MFTGSAMQQFMMRPPDESIFRSIDIARAMDWQHNTERTSITVCTPRAGCNASDLTPESLAALRLSRAVSTRDGAASKAERALNPMPYVFNPQPIGKFRNFCISILRTHRKHVDQLVTRLSI